ncbi:MAG: hypothetical protein ACK42L_04550 [Thermoanaerobaculum sp.]
MSCEDVQTLLEEGNSQEQVVAHLAHCEVCAAHAALLDALRGLAFREVEQPRQWVSRLPHPFWLWRKPQTYLPLVLGLGSLAAGLSSLGRGLPGREELGLLTRAFWEVTGLSVGEALLAASRAAASVWGSGLAIAAAGLGLLGVLVLRWVGLKVRA